MQIETYHLDTTELDAEPLSEKDQRRWTGRLVDDDGNIMLSLLKRAKTPEAIAHNVFMYSAALLSYDDWLKLWPYARYEPSETAKRQHYDDLRVALSRRLVGLLLRGKVRAICLELPDKALRALALRHCRGAIPSGARAAGQLCQQLITQAEKE